jgi:hypothetical protein
MLHSAEEFRGPSDVILFIPEIGCIVNGDQLDRSNGSRSETPKFLYPCCVLVVKLVIINQFH